MRCNICNGELDGEGRCENDCQASEDAARPGSPVPIDSLLTDEDLAVMAMDDDDDEPCDCSARAPNGFYATHARGEHPNCEFRGER